MGILKISVCPCPSGGATCTASSWNRCFSWRLVLMFSRLTLMMCLPVTLAMACSHADSVPAAPSSRQSPQTQRTLIVEVFPVPGRPCRSRPSM